MKKFLISRRAVCPFLLVWAILLINVSPVAADEPLKILFIGNSYTRHNHLPETFAALSEASKSRKIEFASHTPGGRTFEKHLAEEEAVKKIKSRKWDYVVLQEQSQRPFLDPAAMHKSARVLDAAIKAQGAKTVFFLTWARENKPETQDGLNRGYFAIGKEVGAQVAPVGPAWETSLKVKPDLRLHKTDKSHPNEAGTYLAACVFYGLLLEKNPEELADDHKTIAPEDIQHLQKIAWQTVQNLQAIEREALATGKP